MKLHYYADTDSLYIELADRPGADVRELGDGIIMDVDEHVDPLVVLLAVLGRMRRQVGGGLGPTEFSDGHMTTTPTGYPEEMHGHGKTIGPTDNNAANM